jgi:hypothetical protein
MLEQIILWVAVVLIGAASTLLLLSRDWRWSLAMLAVLYMAAFLLILQYWTLGMAAVKLITGWIAISALGMTRQNLSELNLPDDTDWMGARPFRLTGAVIIILFAIAAAPRIENLIPGIGLPFTIGSLIMIGTSLLQLGMTHRLIPVITGLLALLCGFETLYSAVESSILVAGLLSVVNLSLALAGSYLLLNSSLSEPEEELP